VPLVLMSWSLLLAWCRPSCGLFVDSGAGAAVCSAPARRPRGRVRCGSGLDLLDDAAPDHDGVGVLSDRLGTGSVADAESDTDGQRDVSANLREARDHV